ncbi:hypothetical protein CHUV2995_00568 [Corynebacterium diphtheriae subsp. lausannense]|nr:hypothetical protein CHUV2995_00568 [Corynebacterium diphtheriae subsp. lausannense]
MNEATTAGTFRINFYLSSKGSKPAMATDPHHIDPIAYLEELLAQASPDLMRQMLTDFINQILSAQADTVCGADYATVSTQRTNTPQWLPPPRP